MVQKTPMFAAKNCSVENIKPQQEKEKEIAFVDILANVASKLCVTLAEKN